MSDKTQPSTETTPLKLTSTTRAGIRLYESDNDELVELQSAIKHVSNDTILDLIRKAVHLGLPLLKKQWEPMLQNKKSKQ